MNYKSDLGFFLALFTVVSKNTLPTCLTFFKESNLAVESISINIPCIMIVYSPF